jgi:hypothetical protein
MKDDNIAPAGRDHLPVPAADRAIGPPSILDQPRLAYRVDGASVDLERASVGSGAD